MHVVSEKKDVFILDEGLTHGLDDTMITTEAEYPISFTESGSLHFNRSNSFLYVDAQHIAKIFCQSHKNS